LAGDYSLAVKIEKEKEKKPYFLPSHQEVKGVDLPFSGTDRGGSCAMVLKRGEKKKRGGQSFLHYTGRSGGEAFSLNAV